MTDILEVLAGTAQDADAAEPSRLEPGELSSENDVTSTTTPDVEVPPEPSPQRRIVRRAAKPPEELELESAPSATRAPKAPPALEAVRHRLGQEPDAVLATEVGVSRATLRAYRHSLGVPAYEGFLFKPGHSVHKPAKSRKSEAPAAKKRPGRKSVLDRFADRIGVESDATIAALAGVSPGAVASWRRRHGLFRPRRSSKPRGSAQALEPFADQMGTMADDEIAKRAGVNRSLVAAYRRKHGIPAWQGFRTAPRQRRSPLAPVERSAAPVPREKTVRSIEPVPATSPPQARSRRLVAYTVLATSSAGQTEFVAVDEDIVAACRRAERGLGQRRDGPWQVEAVRMLGAAVG